MDEELKEQYLNKDATKLVWGFLKILYLKKNYKTESRISRMLINLDMKYMSKTFKIQRL
jgi:hypothetical protein